MMLRARISIVEALLVAREGRRRTKIWRRCMRRYPTRRTKVVELATWKPKNDPRRSVPASE
jgi:hypothetical protein